MICRRASMSEQVRTSPYCSPVSSCSQEYGTDVRKDAFGIGNTGDREAFE